MNSIRMGERTATNNGPDPPRKKRFRIFTSFVLSVGIFTALVGILSIPRIGIGNRHEGTWTIEDERESNALALPYHEKLKETKTVRLTTVLGRIEGESICFTGLNATALTILFNDTPVYRAADKLNPTANLWNELIAVPLPDSPGSENTLVLVMTGTQVLTLERQPFLEPMDKAFRRSALHRILTHDLLMVFSGASITIGILLILFSIHSNRGRIEGLLFGLSCLCVSLYGLDYSFRISTGTFLFYAVLKRIIIAAGFIGTYSYFAAVDHLAHGRFTITRWAWGLTAAALTWLVSAPTLGILFARLPYADTVLILNCIGIVYLVYKKLRSVSTYVIAAELAVLGVIQIVLIMTVMPNMPSILLYITAIVSTLFGIRFLMEFREALKEREDLREAYNRDVLTNAYNRRALTDIPIANYSSAVFLDLDRFKEYNDTFGHDAGDRVLMNFVKTAKSCIRKDDLVVRYGGDEFIILMKETDVDAVGKVMERIRRHFRKGMTEKTVDFSYGMDLIDEYGNLDISGLDKSMYSMKQRKKRGASPFS